MSCCVLQQNVALSFAPNGAYLVDQARSQAVLSTLSTDLSSSSGWSSSQQEFSDDGDSQVEAEQFALAGRQQRSIQQAFFLFSEADLDFLHSCMCKEVLVQADASYLSTKQQEVDAHKRLMLVDWMVEVVDEFRLSQETLFLAVALLDRFMSLEYVLCCQLQLLGVTCLWVAAKYEEVLSPALQSFVDITDNAYAAEDLIRMESILLTTLRFELAVPTSLHFLHHLLSHAQLEVGGDSPSSPCAAAGVLMHMAEYLLELALLTPDCLHFRPSVVAASALQLALCMVPTWCDPSNRAAYSNLCSAISNAAGVQLDECMKDLQRMHTWACTAARPPCVREKYSNVERGFVGMLQPNAL